jgi:hypothetical protein
VHPQADVAFDSAPTAWLAAALKGSPAAEELVLEELPGLSHERIEVLERMLRLAAPLDASFGGRPLGLPVLRTTDDAPSWRAEKHIRGSSLGRDSNHAMPASARNTAPVRIDEVARDRRPEAQPSIPAITVLRALREGLEDNGQDLQRDALSFVADFAAPRAVALLTVTCTARPPA